MSKRIVIAFLFPERLRFDSLWDSQHCVTFLFALLMEVKGRAHLPFTMPGTDQDSVSYLRKLLQDTSAVCRRGVNLSCPFKGRYL